MSVALLLASALLGDPQLLGRLPFDEVSGIAVGVHGTYVHEDSGSGPVFARIDGTGRVLARFDLGTTARDWEDMAAAPDAAGTPTLWFADVGDNAERRDEVQVHRVAEPSGDDLGRATTARFTYEDGPHDAEALLVLPGGRRLAVVTKDLSGAAVYVAPADGGVLRREADLDLSPSGTPGGPAGLFGQLLVTGGSLVGDRVALRTYTDLYEWTWRGDVAASFAQDPVRSPLPATEQGEAVAYDGDAVLVASEGAAAPLHRLTRTPQGPAEPAAPAPDAPSQPPAVPSRWPLAAGATALVLLAVAAGVRKRTRGR